MNSMSEDIVLLRSVIVGFLELASLYVSNNTDVADTRESPDRRDPFFANIYVELRSMVENLKFLGPTDNDIPSALQDHMKKVLDALESRCTAKSAVNQTDDPHGIPYRANTLASKIPETRYPKLHSIQGFLDSRGRSNLNISDELKARIALKSRHKGNRKHLVKRLTQFNKALEQILKVSVPLDPWPTFPELDSSTKRSLEASRQRVNLLHQALESEWTSAKPIAIMLSLNLSTRGSKDTAEFDLVLCSQTEENWLAATAVVVDDLAWTAKHKTVRFEETTFPQYTNTEAPLRPVGALSTLIRDAAYFKQYRNRVHLVVKNNEMWEGRSIPIDPEMPTMTSLRSLDDLLQVNEENSEVMRIRQKDKYILCWILATAALSLYGAPWVINAFDKTTVCIPITENGTLWNKPYLRTQLENTGFGKTRSTSTDHNFRLHPNPGVLDLGVLLLEIELGLPMERFQSNNDIYTDHTDLNSYIVAQTMLKHCEGDSPYNFVEAARACIMADGILSDQSDYGSMEDPSYRSEFFNLVVMPLEVILTKIFDVHLDQINPPELRLPPEPDRFKALKRSLQLEDELQISKMPTSESDHPKWSLEEIKNPFMELDLSAASPAKYDEQQVEYSRTREKQPPTLYHALFDWSRENINSDESGVQHKLAQIHNPTSSQVEEVTVIEDISCQVNFVHPRVARLCNLTPFPVAEIYWQTAMTENSISSNRGTEITWSGKSGTHGSDLFYIAPEDSSFDILVGHQFLIDHPDAFTELQRINPERAMLPGKQKGRKDTTSFSSSSRH